LKAHATRFRLQAVQLLAEINPMTLNECLMEAIGRRRNAAVLNVETRHLVARAVTSANARGHEWVAEFPENENDKDVIKTLRVRFRGKMMLRLVFHGNRSVTFYRDGGNVELATVSGPDEAIVKIADIAAEIFMPDSSTSTHASS